MIDDYCCACLTDGECCTHDEHTCDLTPEEIAENSRRANELHETFISLKLGEKKQVPSTGRWVEYVMAKSPFNDDVVRTYRFCEEDVDGV